MTSQTEIQFGVSRLCLTNMEAPLLSSSWVAMTATQANIICLPITDPIEGTGWCKDLPTPALCLLITQDPDVTECRLTRTMVHTPTLRQCRGPSEGLRISIETTLLAWTSEAHLRLMNYITLSTDNCP